MTEPEKRDWRQYAGIGCCAAVVIASVTCYLAQRCGPALVRAGTAKVAIGQAERLMDDMKLPDDEKEALMAPIRAFALKFKDGEVTLEQAAVVARQPAIVALMARGFETKYLEPSALPTAEKKAAHVTVSRFTQGVVTEKVGSAKAREIADIITVETTVLGDKKILKLKDAITTDELRKCLKIMKRSADGARIAKKKFDIDLAAELRMATEMGMRQN